MSVITNNVIQPSSGQALTIKDEGGTASITVQTDGDLTLAENAYLGSGKGIYFDGQTTSANQLSDYETGTWTPTTASDSSGTISNNFGHYVKIGRSVLLHGRLQITADFTSSSIGGMPFTCNHLSSGGSGNQSMAYTKTDSGNRYLLAANGLDTLTVRLVSTDGSSAPQSGQIFRFTISYTTTA